MKQINTLIKPTHRCNLRCKYCFSEKYGYDSAVLDINSLKKYLFLLAKKYDIINIVWHGGEPLTIPLEYYKEIYKYCLSLNVKFLFSLQTNGTLLNEEYVRFFKENNTNIGLSFDGIDNEKTRGFTKKIIENLKLLNSHDMYPGAVLVVNQTNVDHLIDNYEYFKSLKLGMKINPIFADGAAKENDFLSIEPDIYIKNYISLFKYWAFDHESIINISTFTNLINLVLKEHSGVCTHNSCLGKWLCFDCNGFIYPCDRLCLQDYELGNIKIIQSIDEIFENENFINLIHKNILKRKNCIAKCEYYKNCYGGCNANTILSENDNYDVSCYIQKEILKNLKNYILNLKELKDFKKLNQNLAKILTK